MSRRSYHHGNLKQALVDATIKLIEEKGPSGFTLSEAAKQAGVSAAAPYRHFKGREDLIIEVARQGFKIFADLLEFAYSKSGPSSMASFESTGQAYLAFARKHPGHYIAMFESGISMTSTPQLALEGLRALEILTRSAEELTAHLPENERPPATMVSHHIWAMSHGVVELFARGEPGARSPYSAEELLESGMLIYLRGLGILKNDD